MKKGVVYGALVIAIVALIYFLVPRKSAIEAQAVEINELPYLPFVKLDGTHMTAHELPGKTIVVMFNTDCDHCQREAKEISDHLQAFQNYTLYFLASDSLHSIAKFAIDYSLSGQSNIFFGRAEIPDVIRTYGPIATPSLYIYSKEKRLVKFFNGETKIEEILNFL